MFMCATKNPQQTTNNCWGISSEYKNLKYKKKLQN